MRVAALVLIPLVLFPPALQAKAPPDKAGKFAPAVSPRAIAKSLAARLSSDFVYPEQGKKYAATLTANAAAGRYDSLSGSELANRLTEDLQSVAVDGHLRVMFGGQPGGPQIIIQRPPESAGAAPPPGAKPTIVRMAPPPEMEQARWIAPGVAFVRFNGFPSEPQSVEAARQFMATYADAKTVIFDLRTHRGGGLAEMDAIFPWLFDKPTRLVSMATRKSVDEAGRSPFEDGPTMKRIDADPDFVTREHWAIPGEDRRLFDAKVYVLTSGYSASAAEHFALAFKHSGRGTLIGRATYGANHFGNEEDLGGGFTAFIPVGRTYDPKTGKDWENVGITPDIDVAPEEALTKALTLAGVTPATAAALSAEVAPKGPMYSPRAVRRP